MDTYKCSNKKLSKSNNCDCELLRIIKNLITNEFNNRLLSNNDRAVLRHIFYNGSELVTDRDIITTLSFNLGGVQTIRSANENVYFRNEVSKISYFPAWGGFRDQSVPANQGPDGMIPTSSRVYNTNLLDVEFFGPVGTSNTNANFEGISDINGAVFAIKFITNEVIVPTDWLFIDVFRDDLLGMSPETPPTSFHKTNGISANVGDEVIWYFDVPSEIYKDVSMKIDIYKSKSQFGQRNNLSVRSSLADPNKPYIILSGRRFENIPIDSLSRTYYSIEMNFYLDDTSTTIIFDNFVEDISNYPVNTIQAYAKPDGNITISQNNSSIVYIQALHLDKTYIEGSLVTQDLNTAINELNNYFQYQGTAINPPNIISDVNVTIPLGGSINYILEATGGVGYFFDNLPPGIIVGNNVRNLIGGSTTPLGTYNINMQAVNSFGEDNQILTLVVSNASFILPYSLQFQKNQLLQINPTGNPFSRTSSGTATPWSFSCWFRTSSSFNNKQTIFSYGGTTTNNGNITLRFQGGSNRLRLQYGTVNGNTYYRKTTPFGGLANNTWHNFVITYSPPDTFKIFIDTIEQTLFSSGVGYNGSIDPEGFVMGKYVYENNGWMLNTRMLEMGQWNTDQSANVADIYGGGNPPDLSSIPNPPLHYWRILDPSTFPIIPDVISANNATMLGMNITSYMNNIP